MKIILNLDSLNSFYTMNIRLIFLLGEWVGGHGFFPRCFRNYVVV